MGDRHLPRLVPDQGCRRDRPAGRHPRRFAAHPRPALRLDLLIHRPDPTRLSGSGLIVVNPPWTLREEARPSCRPSPSAWAGRLRRLPLCSPGAAGLKNRQLGRSAARPPAAGDGRNLRLVLVGGRVGSTGDLCRTAGGRPRWSFTMRQGHAARITAPGSRCRGPGGRASGFARVGDLSRNVNMPRRPSATGWRPSATRSPCLRPGSGASSTRTGMSWPSTPAASRYS